MSVQRRGLIVGKFWPPHNGHQRAFDLLRASSDHLTIVVCGDPSQVPAVFDRAMWIQSANPDAEVVTVNDLCAWHHPHDCPPECTALWVDRLGELGLSEFDVVVASETYGKPFADALGAELIDSARGSDGLSATAIRDDLRGRWLDLPPVVRAGLHRRVVVLGAESTGTTTLSLDLERQLSMPVAPEAGRTLSWRLMAAAGDMGNIRWAESHFWEVVNLQIGLEHQAVFSRIDDCPGELGPWLVCDTDTLATVAWWERYLNVVQSGIPKLASIRLGDLYLVTSPHDVEFDHADPLRDGRQVRSAMHDRFIELVEESGRPWVLLSGNPEERLAGAIEAMTTFEQTHPRWVHL